jgi:hypothetical protein
MFLIHLRYTFGKWRGDTIERDYWIILDEFGNIVATYEIKAGAVTEEEVALSVLWSGLYPNCKVIKVEKEHFEVAKEKVPERLKLGDVIPELKSRIALKQPYSLNEITKGGKVKDAQESN